MPAPATLHLPARPPFRFEHSQRFLCSFAPAQHEQTVAGETLTKAVTIGDRVVGFQIKPMHGADGSDAGIAVTLWCSVVMSDEVKAAAADRIAFAFSLDDDLAEFYRRARRDQAFAPIAESLWGYHQVRFTTPFENACWAVVSQRAPLPASLAMKRALISKLGNSIQVDSERCEAFPSPEQLADWDADDFAAVIRNRRKADYLHEVTQRFLAVDEGFLRSGPWDEVLKWLRDIRGIGPLSAPFVMIRGLGRMEQLPPDPAVRRAAEETYGRRLTEQAFTELAARYGEWRGYWGHYLRVAACATNLGLTRVRSQVQMSRRVDDDV